MTEITSKLANILENNGNYGMAYTLTMNFIGISLGMAFVGIINLYFMAKETVTALLNSITNDFFLKDEKEGKDNNEMAEETLGKPQRIRNE